MGKCMSQPAWYTERLPVPILCAQVPRLPGLRRRPALCRLPSTRQPLRAGGTSSGCLVCLVHIAAEINKITSSTLGTVNAHGVYHAALDLLGLDPLMTWPVGLRPSLLKCENASVEGSAPPTMVPVQETESLYRPSHNLCVYPPSAAGGQSTEQEPVCGDEQSRAGFKAPGRNYP